ncbi:hypothetical protein [uncultured Campylobacter sp.]|nr:hypothetical protein [uncultured Campylobacter sp.]
MCSGMVASLRVGYVKGQNFKFQIPNSAAPQNLKFHAARRKISTCI